MKNKSAKSTSTQQDPILPYPDGDLKQFRKIILTKLSEAKLNHALLERTLIRHHNDSVDSCPTFKFSEDAADIFTKEEITRVALGLKNFIQQLYYALRQIQNKTYGICCMSGQRIDKERLLNFPQTTMCEETKFEIDSAIQQSS